MKLKTLKSYPRLKETKEMLQLKTTYDRLAPGPDKGHFLGETVKIQMLKLVDSICINFLDDE
jgi:hypothetical protein